jgi:hypothetical protein
MNWQRINRVSGITPMVMSFVAFLLVLVAVSAGWEKGQTDEGSTAHIFQILIAGQAPIILLFLITADCANTGKSCASWHFRFSLWSLP